ncbi:AAA-like domain-containing protein [Mastigocoleus sp. MO_188.B34]|uniref:AAA-like domain-containing protein n=1 Tax=Mastigocoleus sp. MO_188.B34 TaxID=3036635 RepID=UPI00262BE3A6|nr:AAA-like domain-containing protein [Mastigocoleus sp. MO_188.B34]MDJ0692846.1 AAA-like domain-containing protein [Mastigocoleus sp. MO_188.B34]
MTATNSTSTSNFYQVGASLPVDAPSYVERKADEEFYQKLLDGKFCYVLNSRQMGKSSLRVRTMQRLQKEGRVCAAIDLTGIGKVTEQQWYGGIVYNLSESCQLEDKFDFDWQEWWEKHQTILSPVQCLSLFIEKVLLANIPEPIVIFVDEIDKVLSQDFSLDDFFALIRFFQNQRVDNPIFKRLTFALLGVATPGDLIRNKTQTPFNIGEAIELHGFQIGEVEPLIAGLRGKVNNPQEVMRSILDWTGGQPFLSQKLCKFMVQNSHGASVQNSHDTSVQNSKVVETYHGTSVQNLVEEIVKARIIENWESQDDPEHLRTIRDRILSNDQRAGYLLELYQQIQEEGEVIANNSVESGELRLSGLVVKRQGKLRVYNRVYQQIFDRGWVKVQLRNLRPYSEAFRAWVASGSKDESRLLQGKALADAEEWAKNKNLSYQDKQFLAASSEKEIQEKIAIQEKEAIEKRNQLLSKANKKAKKRIRYGTVVLIVALLGALSLGVFAAREGEKAFQAQENAKKAQIIAQGANKKAIEASQKFENASAQAEKEREKVIVLQQKAREATNKAEVEQFKAQEAEKIAEDAKRQAKEAIKQAQKAQKNADNATQEATEARKKAKVEQVKAENAKKIADSANQEAQSLQKKLTFAKKDVENVQKLSKLAGELRNKELIYWSDKALRQAGLSFRIDNHHLKQAMLLASMGEPYQLLKQPDEAQSKIDESLKYLNKKGNITSAQGLQIKVIVKGMQGNLIKEKNKSKAITAYQEAYDVLKNHPNDTNPFTDNQIITAENIESVHEELLKLQPKKEVRDSLKEHYYSKLQYSLKRKNWQEADITTWALILVIANRIEIPDNELGRRWLEVPHIEQFSCADLRRMDNLWVKNSNGYFGFSVQKKIWVRTGNRLGIKGEDWNKNDEQNYLRFESEVRWGGINGSEAGPGTWEMFMHDLISTVVNSDGSNNPKVMGGLPFVGVDLGIHPGHAFQGRYSSFLMQRLVKCNI